MSASSADAGGSPDLMLEIFYLKITSGATANIAYTGPAGTYFEMGAAARTFTGLQTGALDNGVANIGTTSSSPDSGSAATSVACEAWTGVIAQFRTGAGGPTSGTWGNSFTNGQTATANIVLSLNEGYRLVSATGNIDAAKSSTVQDRFSIIAFAFD